MSTARCPALHSNSSGSVAGVALGLDMTPDLGLHWYSLVTRGEGCEGSVPLPSSAQAQPLFQPSRLRPIWRPCGQASLPQGYRQPGLWAGTVCTSHSLATQHGVITSQGGLAPTQTTHPPKAWQ